MDETTVAKALSFWPWEHEKLFIRFMTIKKKTTMQISKFYKRYVLYLYNVYVFIYSTLPGSQTGYRQTSLEARNLLVCSDFHYQSYRTLLQDVLMLNKCTDKVILELFHVLNKQGERWGGGGEGEGLCEYLRLCHRLVICCKLNKWKKINSNSRGTSACYNSGSLERPLAIVASLLLRSNVLAMKLVVVKMFRV